MFIKKKKIENKNTYLKIIEFCIDKNEGLTYEDIKNGVYLSNQELGILEMNIIQAYEGNPSSIFHRKDGTLDLSKEQYTSYPLQRETHQAKVLKNATNYSNKYFLTFDAVSNYYDYLELKQARVNAKEAHKTAIISIFISIVALFLSILFSIIQIKSPIDINSKQFEIFKSSGENIINQINNTNNKLDNNNQHLNNINGKLLDIINLEQNK